MFFSDTLPAINALLNATSCVFLFAGYAAIRRRQVQTHLRCMLAALAASSLFLAGYLTRMAVAGPHHIAAGGWFKTCYLLLLFSHMVLAVALLPLIARLLYLAYRRRFDAHRALARYTWPIWVYVSGTGVVVYVLLYHVAPRLAAA